jgi:hypothetical protein
MTACKRASNVARRDRSDLIPADNRFAKMGLSYTSKRTRPVNQDELMRFVRAADEGGEGSLGTAAMFAFFWLQRQEDILGRLSRATVAGPFPAGRRAGDRARVPPQDGRARRGVTLRHRRHGALARTDAAARRRPAAPHTHRHPRATRPAETNAPAVEARLYSAPLCGNPRGGRHRPGGDVHGAATRRQWRGRQADPTDHSFARRAATRPPQPSCAMPRPRRSRARRARGNSWRRERSGSTCRNKPLTPCRNGCGRCCLTVWKVWWAH